VLGRGVGVFYFVFIPCLSEVGASYESEQLIAVLRPPGYLWDKILLSLLLQHFQVTGLEKGRFEMY
jgi:hypothetical protein